MKKNKLTNLLKSGILFFGISLLLWNCEKENIDIKQEVMQEHEFSVSDIDFSDIQRNTELLEKLNKLTKKKEKTVNQTTHTKNEYSPLYDFTVNTDFGKYIASKNGKYHSYTFPVLRNNDKESTKLENLIIFLKENGSYQACLVTYTLTKEERLKLKNIDFRNFEGKITYELINDEGFISSILPKSGIKQCIYVISESCSQGNHPGGRLIDGSRCPAYKTTTESFCSTQSYSSDSASNSNILNTGGGGGGNEGNDGTGDTSNDNPNQLFTIPVDCKACPDAFDDEIEEDDDQINNNLTNKCAKDIFTEIENGIYQDDPIKPELEILALNTGKLNFSQEILHLFASSSTTNFTIQDGNTGASNAFTTGATITIGDNYLANATQLSIARTIIHESVHAYLNALYSNVVIFNSFSFRQKMDKYAKDNGYTVGSNLFHHNFMGQFIDAMAYSLYEWDKEYGSGGNLDWDYYKSMAYSGMFQVDPNGNIATEIDTFKKLVPISSYRQEIANIILNEQKGNNDAKGTKCD
jgi:hypothetical protein